MVIAWGLRDDYAVISRRSHLLSWSSAWVTAGDAMTRVMSTAHSRSMPAPEGCSIGTCTSSASGVPGSPPGVVVRLVLEGAAFYEDTYLRTEAGWRIEHAEDDGIR